MAKFCPHCGTDIKNSPFLQKLKRLEEHPEELRKGVDEEKPRVLSPDGEDKLRDQELNKQSKGAPSGTRSVHKDGTIWQKQPDGSWDYVGKMR